MVMQNLQNLLGGNMVGGARGGSQMPYKIHLGITDGDTAYDTEAEVVAIIGALAAGSVWTKIWEMTVPAQQKYRWGFGSPATPQNQGYMWFASVDEGTAFQVGVLRLVQANSRETRSITVLEIDDQRLHSTDSTTTETAALIDKNEMIALPEKREYPLVGEDSLMQLWYRCVAVATAEDACAFSIPATVYQ
jgi:hypothetical protein